MSHNLPADPPGLDLARLGAYLEREGIATPPIAAQVIQGGMSNLTYLVRDAAGTVLVVRRPPLGHVLATAHDMGREYRVMTALAGSGVPVPRTYALCRDEEVVGAPFYVMEYVPGRILYAGAPDMSGRAEPDPEATGDEDVRKIVLDLADVLALLHSLDYAALGLADFGRPEGYLERQVRRWKRQLDASRSREVPGIDHLHERLAATIPAQDAGHASIVHGDFKLGNTLIGDGGRINAVLDWEMSTLGDPLTDLALFLLYSEMAGLGEGLADRYATSSGRDLSRLGWYVGMACFKLAVISEGIYFRFTQGLTVGDGFDTVGDQTVPLVDRGLDALKED
ncbi:phosphotransferase family protein [Thermopolyspora sp. NPDC052614]|uniref:phosphotransferase family protein n=1 Tax=Thermopolyspora sp. NPDC052614 TaxID=3155682 RepID=UPI00343BBD3B